MNSKSKPVSLALIGVGGVAGEHLQVLLELHRQSLVRLVAVADPGADRFPELRESLRLMGIRWHLNYQSLLAEESELEAVSIATPVQLHLEMAKACIQRGLYVYLEKPPVPLIHQLDELLALDTHRRVWVNFQMLQRKSIQVLKEQIISGELGDLLEIRMSAAWPRLDNYYSRARWAGRLSLDGQPVFDGPATNALAHLLHNAMYFAAAERDGFAVPESIQGELYRARPSIESYDTACLRGRFSNGVTFTAALTHATERRQPYIMEVRGSKGFRRITHDGDCFESPQGTERVEEKFAELMHACYLKFFAIVRGGEVRGMSRLGDTRGYVLATNGLWLSSGGIHAIDGAHTATYLENGELGYDVKSLCAFIEQSLSQGQLFSEMNAAWAVPTQPVSVGDLKELSLESAVARD